MRPKLQHPQGEIHAHPVREVVCPSGIYRELHWLTSDAVVISAAEPLDSETAVASLSLPPFDPDGDIPDCSQYIHCSDCPRPEGCIAGYKERL